MPHNFANQAADFHAPHIIDNSIEKYRHISIRFIGDNPDGDGGDFVLAGYGKSRKAFHIHGVRKWR